MLREEALTVSEKVSIRYMGGVAVGIVSWNVTRYGLTLSGITSAACVALSAVKAVILLLLASLAIPEGKDR